MIVAVGAAPWQHFRQGVSSGCHRGTAAFLLCPDAKEASKTSKLPEKKKVMENVEEKRMKGGGEAITSEQREEIGKSCSGRQEKSIGSE